MVILMLICQHLKKRKKFWNCCYLSLWSELLMTYSSILENGWSIGLTPSYFSIIIVHFLGVKLANRWRGKKKKSTTRTPTPVFVCLKIIKYLHHFFFLFSFHDMDLRGLAPLNTCVLHAHSLLICFDVCMHMFQEKTHQLLIGRRKRDFYSGFSLRTDQGTVEKQ